MAEILIGIVILAVCALLGPRLSRYTLRELLFIALLAAAASGGRFLFASIPSVQPSSFLIIMTTLLLGPAAGFVCGLLTALLSSLFLGFGPWTVWQMLCWSMMGLSAGLILRASRPLRMAFGFVWGFLFGWIMNMWYFTTGAAPLTLSTLLLGTASSFYFDLAHAVTNALLLGLMPQQRLQRFMKTLRVPPGEPS